MKIIHYFLSTLLLILVITMTINCTRIAEVSIIPMPLQIKVDAGKFTITPETLILADTASAETAKYLKVLLTSVVDLTYEIQDRNSLKEYENAIVIKTAPELTEQLGDEGYTLLVEKNGVEISAATSTGQFYGIQTLRQLLPEQIENKVKSSKLDLSVHYIQIVDRPRFSWRAFMLDEARHFKGMAVVKKLLDQMALHKMNVFHWHLTDDQGWRIEIKKYPKLTEIGSKRNDSMIGGWGSDQFSGEPHEGFYTQEQIKEIIQYANERHISVVPEIEMPGHSASAIASYSWLGTIGEEIDVPVTFGKGYDIYNVANPNVEKFLKDVLIEVMELFPSKIIHIGGDEVGYDKWKASETVQAFMEKEGLKSPADLQISFTNRISNFIESHGRRMMGWNEILGGASLHNYHNEEDTKTSQKLAQNSLIHFWKGDLVLAVEALTKGYDIVNSLHSETYLDYDYESIPLEKAYNYNPIPEGLDSTLYDKVLGMGCQMWGEWIPTVERMEYQVYPRLSAYAEVSWTEKDRKNFTNFIKRLQVMKKRWEIQGIKFANLDNSE